MTTEGDETPVSWFVIERGWKVVAADGSEVGTVEETVGDSTHDIFDGITVRTGLLERPRYVPAEQIEAITEGRIRLKLSADEARRLPEYQEPAQAERILPEAGSWWTRLLNTFGRRRG